MRIFVVAVTSRLSSKLFMATARRTYLEMKHPAALRPARVPQMPVDIRLEAPCAPDLYRRV